MTANEHRITQIIGRAEWVINHHEWLDDPHAVSSRVEFYSMIVTLYQMMMGYQEIPAEIDMMLDKAEADLKKAADYVIGECDDCRAAYDSIEIVGELTERAVH